MTASRSRLRLPPLRPLLAALALAADCTAFATGALDAGKMVVVVVGDAEKLKDALAEIGPVEVIRPAAPATPAPPAEPESEESPSP